MGEWSDNLEGLTMALPGKHPLYGNKRCEICNKPMPMYVCPVSHKRGEELPLLNYPCHYEARAYWKVYYDFYEPYSRREIAAMRKQHKVDNRHIQWRTDDELEAQIVRGEHHRGGRCKFDVQIKKRYACSKKCREIFAWWLWGVDRWKKDGIDGRKLPREWRGVYKLYCLLTYLNQNKRRLQCQKQPKRGKPLWFAQVQV
jgi:hypothetical protein